MTTCRRAPKPSKLPSPSVRYNGKIVDFGLFGMRGKRVTAYSAKLTVEEPQSRQHSAASLVSYDIAPHNVAVTSSGGF